MPQKQHERNIVFISELEHIGLLDGFIKEHSALQKEGFALIPLDLEIEYALEEKGIPFRSGRTYRTQDAAVMTLAEEWTASVLESRRWSFFSYRGVSLSRLYFLPMQWYMSHVIYYADIVCNVLREHPTAKRLIVFSQKNRIPIRGSTLSGPQLQALVDVTECIAAQKDKEAVVISAPSASSTTRFQRISFALKRALFGIWIGILNTFITFFRRPRLSRALASDYWKNLAPYVGNLDFLEIILFDRKEAFKAGFSNIWKFRMRFLRFASFSSHASSERAEAGDRIKREWESLKKGAEMPAFTFREMSMRPILSRALNRVVDEVLAKTLNDIDDAHTMFERVKPQIVLLRATMSAQTHFVILAQVARARGVPSLEVQHGLEYYGPGSYTRRHSAEFMGVYGPLTQREMRAVGDAHSTPVIIGSPRFDVYASLRKENLRDSADLPNKGVSFLCIAPAVDPGGDLDTYDYEEYFSAIASAMKKIKNARTIIKFRPGRSRDSFAHRTIASIFADIPHTIVEDEPLSELFPAADVVISCFSTAAIEAMQCGKPLVYLGLSPSQKLMGIGHFSSYEKEGAIRLATTKEDLSRIVEELARDVSARNTLAEQGRKFLKDAYAFDGLSSERTATLVNSLLSSKTR